MSPKCHSLKAASQENYLFQKDLQAPIAALAEQYNYRRYHGSFDNLNPANVCTGRGQAMHLEREKIKRETNKRHSLGHHANAA
ncbi:hypothetical protein [Agrobacterium tumefaciens]|uniref:hypothetical protein n=1 Tax=Agrobacterium tumefaciens TaxID=358 RepID=UPI003BB9892B